MTFPFNVTGGFTLLAISQLFMRSFRYEGIFLETVSAIYSSTAKLERSSLRTILPFKVATHEGTGRRDRSQGLVPCTGDQSLGPVEDEWKILNRETEFTKLLVSENIYHLRPVIYERAHWTNCLFVIIICYVGQ